MTTVSDYTALLSGWYWNPDVKGQPIILSYSFEKAAQKYIDNTEYTQEFINSFESFNATQQNAARQALSEYSKNSGIIFVESAAGTGDLKFAKWDFSLDPNTEMYGGFAYYPDRGIDTTGNSSYDSDIAGDIFIDKAEVNSSEFLGLLLHEIGHAVGLKHPFDGDPVLDTRHDRTSYTVMSYTGRYPNKLAPFDVDAIRHIFGNHDAVGSPLLNWSWDAPSRTLSQTWDNAANTISGTNQNDRIGSAGGADVVAGFAGNDTLDGGSGNDTLFGGVGDDVLFGGAGNDTLLGGADRYDVKPGNDTVDYGAAQQSVTVHLESQGKGGTAMGDDIGRDALWGIRNVVGGKGDDTLSGNDQANRLEGGDGDDYLFVGGGGDQLIGGDGSDTAFFGGFTGTYITVNLAAGVSSLFRLRLESIENLVGNNLPSKLTGDAGENVIEGGQWNDRLDGGAGADTLIGGGRDDTFYVDNAGDKAIEATGNGDDRILTSVNYALTAGSEIETFSTTDAPGTATLRLTGNEFAQTIAGNAGANTIDGKAGADALYGYGGNDLFYVDNAGDRVLEAVGRGSDRVYTSVSYALAAASEIETVTTNDPSATTAINLTGNEFAQKILGNAGANIIDGKAGADVLYGFGGNDRLYVDNAGDKAIEAVGGGDDRVFASFSYTLGAGSEIETFTTTDSSATTAINLTGNEFAQKIVGNAGANIIDGKAGADTMYGYGGNDLLYVDNAGDNAIEATGKGNDRVLTSVNYALTAGSEIEIFSTTDSAGTAAIKLTGNEFAQTIAGNAGANIVDGKAGADALYGYGGNDRLYVDNSGDKAIEAAGGGDDRVFASVSYTLNAGSEIETFTTFESSATTAINLTGNEFAQKIVGNAGSNVINGKAGNDTLYGYGGNDFFVFDTALNSTANVDAIVDFNVAADTIRLDNAIFTHITGTGTLTTDQFWKSNSGVAHDASDRIIYETDTGKLFYDLDGTGTGAAIQFATLTANLLLTNADFNAA